MCGVSRDSLHASVPSPLRRPGITQNYMRILQLPRHHALVGAVLLAFASQAFAQTPQTLIFNGGSDDRGNAIVTDAAGNILVGGSSSSSTASSFVF